MKAQDSMTHNTPRLRIRKQLTGNPRMNILNLNMCFSNKKIIFRPHKNCVCLQCHQTAFHLLWNIVSFTTRLVISVILQMSTVQYISNMLANKDLYQRVQGMQLTNIPGLISLYSIKRQMLYIHFWRMYFKDDFLDFLYVTFHVTLIVP